MSQKALPWVIPEYCEGCTSCIAACKKKGCLSMFATAEEGIFIPWIEDPDLCTGCGLCTQACVMGGISMTTYQEEAAQRFRSYIDTNVVRKVYF